MLIMSQYLNLEEGGGNSMSERFQRGSPSGAEVKRISTMREFTKSFYVTVVTKFFSILTKIIIFIVKLYFPDGPLGNSTFFVLCMASMITDPLFLYIPWPWIENDKKCFRLDFLLGVIAIGYRAIYDFMYFAKTILQMPNALRQNSKKDLLVFLIDIFIVLPVPQVLVILVLKIGHPKFFLAMNFFILQHVLKVVRLYTLFQKAKPESDLARLVKSAFYLSYIHAGHVFGAIWYFFAVERKTLCWRKACRNNSTGCDHLSFYCNEKSGNYTISNDFCSATTYDFGIFRDAIESGAVEGQRFFQRFIPCFRWGLQNLVWSRSPFSANLPESIFVLSITISGVVLFFFLIGKVQSETAKSEERKQKLKEIERWVPFGELPKELQKQVRKYQSEKWRETRGVDVESFLNNLPEDLRKHIKWKLCLGQLKKVEGFGKWSDDFLEELCDVAKPAFYTERSYVVREGEPIDQMLFVLLGKLWTYTSKTITESSSIDDDLCGIELVSWAQDDGSKLPVSTRTIQALTNVEAFVLSADDLKKRLLLIIEKDRAARCIQLFWRSRRNAKTFATQGTTPRVSSAAPFGAFKFCAGITHRH